MAEQSTALTRAEAPQRLVVHDPVAVFDTGKFELMQRLATLMSRSTLVPETLRKGDPQEALANCFLVVGQAQRWGMDPFAVAQSVSVIHGKLCYEGKLVAAVLAAKLGVRLRYEWNGRSGDAMGITVTGHLDGADLSITGTVGDWKTTGQGSPWKPSQYQKMLAYRGAREWARLYAPEVMLGVYTPDEMAGEVTDRADKVVDITPAPTVATLPVPAEPAAARQELKPAPLVEEPSPPAGPPDDAGQSSMFAEDAAEPDDMAIVIRDAITEASMEKDPAKRRAIFDALPRDRMTDQQVAQLTAAFQQMAEQAGKARGKAAA
jgi:RecT family protein